MAMDNAKMNKAGTMRKVLSYMKRYIPLLVISLALSVVTVALRFIFQSSQDVQLFDCRKRKG